MQDAKQAKLAEIDRRYKRRKKRPPPPLVGLRIRDLNRLLTARYGEVLPDDDAGRDDVEVIVHHLAQYATGHPARRINEWCRLRAPWLSIAELDALTIAAVTKPKRWRADKLAWRMRLTEQDRKALKITTIGAIDLGKAERTKRRRERERNRKMAKRRAKGMKSRAEYEKNSANRTKPWAAEGISRAAWYRRRKAA